MKSANRLPRVFGSVLLAVVGWLLPPGHLEAQVAVPGWTVNVHATDVSTVSGGEALAADLGTGNLVVKSLQDPAGSHVQLAEVTPGGAVTILATYPALRNADISGVAIDPLTGGIIVADEADVGRIALVNRSTLGVSTLFDIPWAMNPASNGTGQQQYAPDPGNPDVLYFWDSSVSKVFRLHRSTNTLLEILALDQGTADGLHVATFTNDLVLDPATGTLLVTDGASNSVLEVDPGASPPTVTTLFSGFSRPTAIALNPSTDEVFVVDSNSIFVGSRAGGPLSLVASGFSFLTDIVVGTATTGTGLSLFAVDKALDTVYEIVAQVGPPASKEQCKRGGWKAFNTPRTFENQGDCIQFFNTGE
jgi:DNA-binding beta-propeller fold protein YncE